MAGPSSRDRLIEFAGNGRLPLDDEHPVWADCRGRIEASAHGEIVAMAQRAATPDPLTTASGDDEHEPPPGADAVLDALAAFAAPPAAGQIAAVLGCSVKSMAPVVAKLVRAGRVATEGAHRAKRYFVAPAAPAPDTKQAALPLDVAPPFADEPAPTSEPAPEQAATPPAAAIESTEQSVERRRHRRAAASAPTEEQPETQV